jgi:hypothetical protein
MDQSVRLHRSLLRFAHVFLIQTTHTALAKGRSKLEERLARWLLTAQDRIDGTEVPLTHRFLAVMLGVHRPFVTRTVQALERKCLIRAGRQTITILDGDWLGKNFERCLFAARLTNCRCWELNTSQPNISKSIADLEHALGVRLLDRHRCGIEPTQYGQALLDGGWMFSTNCARP